MSHGSNIKIKCKGDFIMLAIALISMILVYVLADEVIVYQKRKDLRRKYRSYERYQALTVLSDHNDIV